ncbi:MAG: hypothetical protein K8R99_13265 [Actinomycetia bacterium]|nr:hypothetical protein [Actinomycetes bacterium]
MQFVWLAVLIVVIGAMWWIGYRMEPHWVSKDGQRFMCGTQEFFHGTLAGHPRETQVAFMAGGTLHITQKRVMRRQRSLWTLVGKSADPPKGLEIYVAQQSVDGVATQTMLALRIPKKSRCIALLDAELAKADAKAGRTSPKTV